MATQYNALFAAIKAAGWILGREASSVGGGSSHLQVTRPNSSGGVDTRTIAIHGTKVSPLLDKLIRKQLGLPKNEPNKKEEKSLRHKEQNVARK